MHRSKRWAPPLPPCSKGGEVSFDQDRPYTSSDFLTTTFNSARRRPFFFRVMHSFRSAGSPRSRKRPEPARSRDAEHV